MKKYFDYTKLIDEAMLNLVKKCLIQVKEFGLNGEHHFYITFQTNYPGVDIGEELTEKYPTEMTIVLQYQFWDLEIFQDRFIISLNFDSKKHKLTVPFDSIVSFVDPSVQFGLQFQYKEGANKKLKKKVIQKKENKDSNVVTLDQFRKKDD